MIRILSVLLLLFSLFTEADAQVASIRAGLAKRIITPKGPIWLTGYANREKPASGVVHDLWAKALVIEQLGAEKFVLVTADLLGLSHDIVETVADSASKKWGIPRDHVLFNSSHTHSGPMVWPCLSVIMDYAPADQQVVSAYTLRLVEELTKLIGNAIAVLQPAQLEVAHGSVGFARNRRVIKDGKVSSGVNESGPVDHDVPVIQVKNGEGKTMGMVFGYACHNTTVTGENYLVNGDYAGFAQIELEKQYPEAIALYVTGTAGDQNPFPRGTMELAKAHGTTLASEVAKVLEKEGKPLTSRMKGSIRWVDLPYQPYDMEQFRQDMTGTNKFLQRRAALVLGNYNKGWKPEAYRYPVQLLDFGGVFTIVGLAGEVVVDYSKRIKEMYKGRDVFVAGYCNEVMCYIPSKRILEEGGYEAETSMIYYGMPGAFDKKIEELIISTVRKQLKN